jgi:MotA/TolQ/ExbB proton channel family
MANPTIHVVASTHRDSADSSILGARDLPPVSGVVTKLRRAYRDAIRDALEASDVVAVRYGEMPAQPVTQLAFFSRFVVLQAIGGAMIVGLWIAGVAGKPFESSNGALCWIIIGMGLLGIACVFMQRWNDVQWLATHVVRIGLLGTVVGLIIAFSAAGQGGSTNPEEIKPMIAAVVNGMYVSLYATLLGIGVNLWLKVNLRLLGNFHG